MIILICPKWLRDLIEDWLVTVAEIVGEVIEGPYRDRYATITPEELDALEGAA